MDQGTTNVNGPHQGGWVTTPGGEDWFIHFQDRGAYGRIVHLQPMAWRDDWPVIGADPDGDGTGEPVAEWRMPDLGRAHPPVVPQTSDEYANPRDAWYGLAGGRLRLHAAPMPDSAVNLWRVPSLLTQMLPAPTFHATTRLSFAGLRQGEAAGLVMMGLDYAWLAVRRTPFGAELVYATAKDAHQGGREMEARLPIRGGAIHLRVTVDDGAVCRFWFSQDGRRWQPAGGPFTGREGRWIGARVGVFALAPSAASATGHAEFDFFRITPPAGH